MRLVTITELRRHGLRVLDGLSEEGALLTRRGSPVAVLVRLDEGALDALPADVAPGLLSEIEDAGIEFERKGGLGHEAMKARIAARAPS